jgi:hypothetical protein
MVYLVCNKEVTLAHLATIVLAITIRNTTTFKNIFNIFSIITKLDLQQKKKTQSK